MLNLEKRLAKTSKYIAITKKRTHNRQQRIKKLKRNMAKYRKTETNKVYKSS